MSISHDAYAALLSGLTYKVGNEIYWYNEYNEPVTIEFIDTESNKYIVRRYYSSGQKYCETEYKNGQRHGKIIGWYKSGQKHWEDEYQDGKRHGKAIRWCENGNKYYEVEYAKGVLYYVQR